MCTLMRDISANIAILDMIRGAPSIYMLYLGYDEVAHHSGPWTRDAFGDLRQLEQDLCLRRVIQTKAPRPTTSSSFPTTANPLGRTLYSASG